MLFLLSGLFLCYSLFNLKHFAHLARPVQIPGKDWVIDYGGIKNLPCPHIQSSGLLEDNVLNAVSVWKRKVANGSEIGSNYWASLPALSRRLDEAQRVVIARCWHIQACLLSRPLTFTDTLIGGTDRHPELLTTASVLHCVQRLPIDSLACVCESVYVSECGWSRPGGDYI